MKLSLNYTHFWIFVVTGDYFDVVICKLGFLFNESVNSSPTP